MKAKRLALIVKANTPADPSPTARERLTLRQARYELQQHLDAVSEDA